MKNVKTCIILHFIQTSKQTNNKQNLFFSGGGPHGNVQTEKECLTAGEGTRGWASAPPSEFAWVESEPRLQSYEEPEARMKRICSLKLKTDPE